MLRLKLATWRIFRKLTLGNWACFRRLNELFKVIVKIPTVKRISGFEYWILLWPPALGLSMSQNTSTLRTARISGFEYCLSWGKTPERRHALQESRNLTSWTRKTRRSRWVPTSQRGKLFIIIVTVLIIFSAQWWPQCYKLLGGGGWGQIVDCRFGRNFHCRL